jgi:hypothetical protein
MLFDGRVPNVNEAARGQQAERLTERFLRYYHYAAPFDPHVVEAAWRRCRGEQCEERQRAAWQSLSSLDHDTTALSESAAQSPGLQSGAAFDPLEDEEEATAEAGPDRVEIR